MNILSSGVFWGLILVLIGLAIIIRVVFNIDIPVFRIIIGLLLIYFGLQVMFGSSFLRRRRVPVRHHEREFYQPDVRTGSNEYNVVFGRSTIDLRDNRDLTADNFVEINVVFGSALIYVDPATPLEVEVSTVFGSAHLPGKNVAMIGHDKFRTGETGEGVHVLRVQISSVFSSVELVERHLEEDSQTGTTNNNV